MGSHLDLFVHITGAKKAQLIEKIISCYAIVHLVPYIYTKSTLQYTCTYNVVNMYVVVCNSGSIYRARSNCLLYILGPTMYVVHIVKLSLLGTEGTTQEHTEY